jgi:hypothetical protein
VAEIEAWTLYVASAFALAAKWTLPAKVWRPQIEIALKHIYNTLTLLHDEVRERTSFIEGGGLLDRPFVQIRLTIIAGMLGVLESWPQQSPGVGYADAINTFHREHQNQFVIWSEAAIPYWLAMFWHLRRHDATCAVDFILRDLIQFIARVNHPDSRSALANPYYELPEILPHFLGLTEDKIQETFRGRSYLLESVVHLFVRRNWKQATKRLWPDVSRIQFARFYPDAAYQFFVWRCQDGVNRSTFPRQTQEWAKLVKLAEESAGDCIPEIARAYPHFILLYLLVCPHRANAEAIRWLDSALAR